MNDSRKKMLERVRAILAKTISNGCTEGEAMAALAKAQELMDAYDISEAELGLTEEIESVLVHENKCADPYKIKAGLAYSIACFTRRRGWRGGSEYAYGFAGLESDVAFATWLLDTLATFALRELKAYQARRKANGLCNPRIVSVSFVRGCAERIGERLRELTPSAPITTTGKAMTVSRNALIAEAMKKAGIVLRNSRSYVRLDGASYGAGQAAGNAARFDRPVSAGSGALRLAKLESKTA
jgi:Protein of unknown function (DUF2786)